MTAFTSGNKFNYLVFGEKEESSGALIGFGGLVPDQDRSERVTIGFGVHSKKKGKGYGTQIAKAFVDLAFAKLDFQELYSNHAEGNEASGAVLKKLGFHCFGIAEKAHDLLTHIVDDYRYLLKKPQFKAKPY